MGEIKVIESKYVSDLIGERLNLKNHEKAAFRLLYRSNSYGSELNDVYNLVSNKLYDRNQTQFGLSAILNNLAEEIHELSIERRIKNINDLTDYINLNSRRFNNIASQIEYYRTISLEENKTRKLYDEDEFIEMFCETYGLSKPHKLENDPKFQEYLNSKMYGLKNLD